MTKLSIITICYNEPNLEKTCESIVNQTWQDFEWIVVDGGSNEETQAIWNKYKYRIDKFISEPDNGRYDAMNKGIRLATGEYLNFMNAGDCFKNKDVLKKVVNKNLDKDIVFGNILVPQRMGMYKVQKFPDTVDDLFLFSNSLPHQASFIKRNLFNNYGLYSEEYKIVSDWEKWFIFILQNNCSYKHINLTCCVYNLGGISSQNKKLTEEERKIVLNKFYTEEQLERLASMQKVLFTFWEHLFSIKISTDRKHRIISILGIKCKFRINLQQKKFTLNYNVNERKKFYQNILESIIQDVQYQQINLKPKEQKIIFEGYTNLYSKLDPLGTILLKDGKIYRGIYKEKCDYFISLWEKGIIQALIKHNIIVDTKITDFYTDEFPIILESKKLSTVSPHFWSYTMLKEAAINTSILLQVLNHFDYTLCDGHSGNTRFDGNKAKWIDLGSIIAAKNNKNVINEVISNQLVPLCMLSFGNKYYFSHRLYHESANTLCNDTSFINSVESRNILNDFIKNCDKKTKSIARLLLKNCKLEPEYIDVLFNYDNVSSCWSDYCHWDKTLNNIKDRDRYIKTIELIKEYASDAKSCIDLAGNSGYFSALLSKNTNIENIISTDYDEDAIEYGIRQCKENGININFGLLNFMIPTDTASLKYLKSDIAVALAVTHHLILTQGYNIDSIFNMISKYTNKYACFEFCPLGMYGGGDDLPTVPDWYTQEWFEEHVKKFFDIIEVKITNWVTLQNKEYAHRILYICKLKI